LWRKAPLRLEAETIRDSMLKVSGLLNERMFGRQEPIRRGPDGQWLEDNQDLESRIANYELAARMHVEALNVANIDEESEATVRLAIEPPLKKIAPPASGESPQRSHNQRITRCSTASAPAPSHQLPANTE
jgi:hypothetical protein